MIILKKVDCKGDQNNQLRHHKMMQINKYIVGIDVQLRWICVGNDGWQNARKGKNCDGKNVANQTENVNSKKI